MRKLLCIASLAGLLAACGGDKQTATIPPSWSPTNTLTYAYPYNGQTQIAPTSPIVLHFAGKLTETDAAAVAAHFTLTGEGNPTLTATLTDGGKGVMLTPSAKLAENKTYSLSWSNLTGADGAIKPVPLSFMTRPANDGARSAVVMDGAASPFTVARTLPAQNGFPLMDFSSVRVQFTQPMDQRTLQYGSSVSLVDAGNKLVPARLLAGNRLLTIDPVDDLVPGQNYTLKITSALKSSLGDSFDPGSYSWSFKPLDSKPREILALQAPDSNGGKVVSPLTGAAINNVPITSALLGNDSASQTTGNLYAQLAFVPNYPKATPLRVARGNILTGSSVVVKIAGQVPAGLETGAIRVDFLSDANGYMTDNPYSTLVDAPKQVYLTMDVAMSADDPSANGAFNQNIMHVDVVGTAIVKNGKLVMDAVGVVELDVLGIDKASGVLSFHLEGYQDQPNAPKPTVDTTAPQLQSWTAGVTDDSDSAAKTLAQARIRPGDPVILNFTEPLDPQSINSDSVKFLKFGVAEPASLRVDGTSIVLQPTTPLLHGSDYSIQLSSAVTDVAGNALAARNLGFQLATLSGAANRSPVVLATYPGFPCPTTAQNIAANAQGRCVGGKPGDEAMPIATLPTDRNISVQFSQTMNAASINSTTFKVEVLGDSGWTAVSGRLEKSAQSVRFAPDARWSEGKLYRYTLVSTGNLKSSAANCGVNAICGSNGLPLQTQLLSQAVADAAIPTGGGPSMDIMFRGAAPSLYTLQRLRGLPASDVNADFVHGSDETEATGSGDNYSAVNAARIQVAGQSGLVQDANIGCDVGSSCPAKQFLYLSNALDAEVANYDSDAAGVKVMIQPTQIVASSVDVYADAGILLGKTTAATGPQVLRLRYGLNPDTGKRDLPITGYIRSVGGKLQLKATLDLYLDEPTLQPKLAGFNIGHNLYSYPLTISVTGPVDFLPDGRMLASLINDDDVVFTVNLVALGFLPGGTITMKIPRGTMQMQGLSGAIKQ
ncbi:MAG TPA: Ig-like domain-containing protein [Moraxellaceae bacterium]